MIIFNFKNYPESVGANSMKLLAAIETAVTANPEIASMVFASPPVTDLALAREKFPTLQLMSPHVDNKGAGSTTGWVPPTTLLAMGIEYSVLNHSEHRLMNQAEIVEYVKTVQAAGVKLVVCCENLEEAKNLLEAQPYAIAFEDKDLIGSGQSITTGRPDDVKAFIEMCKDKTVAIIGAGVSTGDDIKGGVEMGAEGFILASAFVKAADPVAKVQELAAQFK